MLSALLQFARDVLDLNLAVGLERMGAFCVALKRGESEVGESDDNPELRIMPCPFMKDSPQGF
jgi:hypothetical protein